MNTNTLITVIVVIVILVGGAFLFLNQGADPALETEEETTLNENNDAMEEATEEESASTEKEATSEVADEGTPDTAVTAEEVVVTYTGSGFNPETVTINAGETVRFVNESGRSMWVASDDHPTHTHYSGTSRSEHCATGGGADAFDQCSTGDTYSFTFDKAGTWEYHNHVGASDGGTVIVQ